MNRPRPRFRPGLLVLAGALLLAPVAPSLASAATAAEAAGAAGAAAPPAVVPAWTPAPPTPSTTPMNPTPTPTTGPPYPTDYPTPTPTPTTALRCSATWRLVSDWPGAFHAEVTVRNTGTSPMARWAVRLTLPEGQGVRDIWNATISSTIDGVVTIGNTDWNGRIAPGASTAFGMIGTGPATAPTLSCIAV